MALDEYVIQILDSKSHSVDIHATVLMMDCEPPRAMLEIGTSSTYT